MWRSKVSITEQWLQTAMRMRVSICYLDVMLCSKVIEVAMFQDSMEDIGELLEFAVL